MIGALAKLVAAQHPRPERLSNEGCCYSDDHLASILAKPDSDLEWADFQTLMTIARCTGTYDELVYFVPLCIRYCEREPEEAINCLSELVYFLSHEFDRLRDDGLAELVAQGVRDLFVGWTSAFGVTHFDRTACQAKGWRLTHFDIVHRCQLVGDLLDDLLRFQTFAGLAEELVASLAASPVGGPRGAWYLAYAHACRMEYAQWLQTREKIRAELRSMLASAGVDPLEHDDTPPWSQSANIVRLVNDTDLLRRHFRGIEATVIAAEPSPTYWDSVRTLLDFPASELPVDPAATPPFSVADAKPYRPKVTAVAPPQDAAEKRGPLWPKLQAQRDQMAAAMEALASLPGAPEGEALQGAAAMYAAMGRRFQGRVPGFEGKLAFRLLVVSGNFALCEDEDGPLRILFKDFVAAVEAGQLIEVPDEEDRITRD